LASSYAPFLLEAVMGGRTLLVRVSPEPALEAIVNGRDIMCVLNVGGQKMRRRRSRSE
jgi:hypothetical protein